MDTPAAPIIYINGWPGSGKETISRILEKQFPEKIRVVRNHLHIDLAEAVTTRASPDYQSVRKALRTVIFSAIAAENNLGFIYVFTDCQSDNELGASVAKEYQEAARLRGSTFRAITLVCGAEENERRVQSEGRMALVDAGSGKLVDVAILKDIREHNGLFRFDGGVEQLNIDVTFRDTEETAEILGAYLELER